MRLGLVSDIHCNIESLDRALDRMGNVDEVLCAGDLIFSFRFSNEVIQRLREINARVVLGNHDLDVLGALGDRVRDSPNTDPAQLAWLKEQPTRLDTVVNGKKLTMFHATPELPLEYVYRETPQMKQWTELGADYVVYGHTHVATDVQLEGTRVINPGSAGQPRDPGNGFRSTYAILDTQSDELTIDTYEDPVHRPRD